MCVHVCDWEACVCRLGQSGFLRTVSSRFEERKFRSQAGMLLTSGYVLIVHILIKSGDEHNFRCDLSKTKL